MSTMTRRERLRRAYFHEELDRPGVYSRTSYPPHDPSYDKLKAYLAAHAELKQVWHPNISHEPWISREEWVEPVSTSFERLVTVLHTPAGDFSESRLNSLSGQPGMPETYFVKTREDAERWLTLPMPEVGGHVSEFFELDAKMGDAGIIDVNLGRSPGGFIPELIGSKTLAFMSITDRDVLHALCERRMNILLDMVKYLVERRVGTYFGLTGQERIAPPLHGPKDFWDFNVKYDRPINDLIHEHGGAVHVHCHGALGLVFQGFLDMGVDVLHPVEPPPMGDLPAAKAKELAGGRLTIEGNIQTAHIYEHTPEEIRAETEQLIQDAFVSDHKGLIVSTTASPWIRGAGESSFPMYKAMVDTTINWKG